MRGTSFTGDLARYERYRDLGDGLFLERLRFNRQQHGWFFGAQGDHVGRLDQRLAGTLVRPGVLKVWGMWDQIPMIMSQTTQTLYLTTSPGVFRIPTTIQTALQAQPTAISSMVQQFARPFDTESHRHIADGGLQYLPDVNTTVSLDVTHTNRTGVIPYGGTFGFSNAIELPAPVDHHLTNVDAGLERASGPLLLRLGYTGSWFRNDVPSITWDNPYRLTDSATAPSRGQEALAPSNTWHNVNGSVSYKMPSRSRLTGYFALGVLTDNGATLLPMTINTALPVIPLDRQTVGGDAHTKAGTLTFTSHPVRDVNLDIRYRYYNYDNLTPIFTQTQRVAYDTAVQVLNPPNTSARYGGTRQSFDANVNVATPGRGSLGAGVSRQQADYKNRIFTSSVENGEHVSFDAISTQWFVLHSKFEHAVRRGRGLDTSELVGDGEQPGIRTFDIADRNRDLFTLTGSIMPLGSLAINLSVGTGRDTFPNSAFGLYNANHHVYSVGVDATPGDHVTLSASYDLEDYTSLQWSRQASPGVQFTDPSRDWSTNGHDRVHSVLADVQVLKIGERVNLKLGFDFSRGNTLYLYGGAGALITVDRTLPEESLIVPSSLPPPKQLPPVTSELTRGTFDAIYTLTSRLDLGITYWYERYRVSDFALDAQAIPTINLPNSLLIGYQYLPYTAHTFWGRLVYRW